MLALVPENAWLKLKLNRQAVLHFLIGKPSDDEDVRVVKDE